MIDLYYWPTPNGWKITIALEELGLPYAVEPVNIGRGEQFEPAFLAISPNNRMPAIVDHQPPDGGAAVSVFESGAILQYLAEKTGKLGGRDLRERIEVAQWLFWQVGGLGPMAGQNGHFRIYAQEKIPYAIERYTNEVNRLYGVLDRRLADRRFIAGSELSIADIAIWPWVRPWEHQGQRLDDFASLARWFRELEARPAFQRGFEVGAEHRAPKLDDEARKQLFGQTAKSVRGD
jgi:GST-like protein